MKQKLLGAVLLLACSTGLYGQSCSAITPGFNLFTGGALNGFIPFPQSTGWHADITGSPVDPRSSTWIADLLKGAPSRRLLSLYNPATSDAQGVPWNGIPYHVVGANQPRVEMRIDTANGYPLDSDPGPMPIPFYPRVQTTFGPGTQINYSVPGDKHLIVIDKDNCLLYELWEVTYTQNKVVAEASAVFDMLGGDHQRPYGLTSASVSGLPLFPGLLRGDELAAGSINHPIIVSAYNYPSGNSFPDKSYTDMASHHQYGNGDWSASMMPIGSKMRLRANFDVSSFSPQGQLILNAMKTYGAILTDGGNTIDIYGTTSNNWDTPTTASLYNNFGVTPDDFDVIQTGPIYCDPLYSCGLQAPTGPPPTISSFGPDVAKTAAAGQPVTLHWNVSGVPTRIRFITPEVGPVVTDSVIVKPLKTTTYTLMVENAYGRATASTTIVVGNQIYVGVNPGLIPNAVSMNMNMTTSNGDLVSVPCSVSPCMIPLAPGVTGQSLQIQYLSANGSVLATSGNMSVNVR